jgi:hypothetical protein
MRYFPSASRIAQERNPQLHLRPNLSYTYVQTSTTPTSKPQLHLRPNLSYTSIQTCYTSVQTPATPPSKPQLHLRPNLSYTSVQTCYTSVQTSATPPYKPVTHPYKPQLHLRPNPSYTSVQTSATPPSKPQLHLRPTLSYTSVQTSTLVSKNLRLTQNSNPGRAPPPPGSDVRMGLRAQWNRSPSVVSIRRYFTGFRYRKQYQQYGVCRPNVFNYFNEPCVPPPPQVCRTDMTSALDCRPHCLRNVSVH